MLNMRIDVITAKFPKRYVESARKEKTLPRIT